MAKSGFTALVGGLRLPPGRQASVISLAAIPKKKTMKMSFTRKWTVSSCPRRVMSPKGFPWIVCAYHSGARFAVSMATRTPQRSGIENSWRM